MYKAFTAEEHKRRAGIASDYTVDGFIVFGTYNKGQYQLLKDCLNDVGVQATFSPLVRGKDNLRDFFDPILEFRVGSRTYWFTIAYGGTMLSEWVHLACLWGSQTNIVVGDCGGLLKEANTHDIVIPTFAHADESTTRMYEPDTDHRHFASEYLNEKLSERLEKKHKVWLGPTVTCQAMLAETWEDVTRWSSEGYYGVEMEAATVFAVSNHFKRQAAAVLGITDNLAQEKTALDINFEASGDDRQQVRRELLTAALQELLRP